jgi:two-component system, OmpR family, phosphate regulon sensor histidine kinase PhoR
MRRRRRLFWRIYATYLVVIVLCTAAVGFYAVRSARSFYLTHTESELQARAQLVREQVVALIGDRSTAGLEALVNRLGAASHTRITVISGGLPGAPLGKVLADSESVPSRMVNHSDRPEFIDAMRGRSGVAIRHSATLNEDMMYVAVPVMRDDRASAVVRTAIPLTTVNRALGALYSRIGFSALFFALVAAGIGLLVSARISRQMRDIKQGAQRLAGGDFSHKVFVPRTEEFAAVAESLNHMAAELDRQISTLTRERNERQAVLSSMVEGVLAVDPDERIIAVNEAAAGFIDVEPAVAEGKTIQEVLRNPDLQRVVAQTLSGQEPVEADIAVRVGFEDRFLQANGTLLKGTANDAAAVVGAVVVLNDVTRLKRLEAVRRDFVANVSHELKTPVTSIKGFAETLEDGALEDPEAAHRFVRIISGQADRLNSIIGDLLALSTLEQGGDDQRLSLEEADICEVVQAAVEVCEHKAQVAHIDISVSCAESMLAAVNAPLLEQAVVNLIDNAVKYSPAGSRVDVTLDQSPGEIVIGVSDCGPGISREHLSRLFERFYRVDKARSRDLGGTGLGLSIVKHIAQAHGGSVAVESVVGEGSTFSIHLPHH